LFRQCRACGNERLRRKKERVRNARL
jgi:ribosomal protein L40E